MELPTAPTVQNNKVLKRESDFDKTKKNASSSYDSGSEDGDTSSSESSSDNDVAYGTKPKKPKNNEKNTAKQCSAVTHSGDQCLNKTYGSVGGTPICGVHVRNKNKKVVIRSKGKKVIIRSKKAPVTVNINPVYKGSKPCSVITRCGNPCHNKCYYDVEGVLACGIHIRGKKDKAVKLGVDPNAYANYMDTLLSRREEVNAATTENQQRGCRGSVLSEVMIMYHASSNVPGYTKIYLCARSTRSDGISLLSLHPYNLGPITPEMHGMTDLPAATNMQNWWIGSQNTEPSYGNVLTDGTFTEMRERIFQSESYLTKHPKVCTIARKRLENEEDRRNATTLKSGKNFIPKRTAQRCIATVSGSERCTSSSRKHGLCDDCRKRIKLCEADQVAHPQMTMWIDPTSNMKTISQAKQNYARMYQRLVEDHPDYIKLQTMLAAGQNLQFIGYNSPTITIDEENLTTLYQHDQYFFHEACLLTMLCCQKPYPWE